MLYPQRTAMGLCLLAAVGASAPAQAQILDLKTGREGVERDPAHDSDLANNEINKADCLRNETIQFHLDVSGVISDEFDFQVWRGTDCTNDDRRYDSASNCTQIMVDEDRRDRSINFGITVPALIFGRTNTSAGDSGAGGTSGTGGTSGAGGTGAAGAGGTDGGTSGSGATSGAGSGGTSGSSGSGNAGTSGDGGQANITSCDGDRNFPSPQALTLHFIYVNGSNQQPSSNYQPAIWEATYDLVGPNAPSGVSAGVGENTLILSWDVADRRGDIDHFRAYCDPPPSAPAEPGDDSCRTTSLISGEEPPAELLCGQSDGYSASMQTSRLQNNVHYAVAVAAVDNFKNVGLLSDFDCEAPQLVRDFYEAYREAGGKGGGGFCSIGAGRSPAFGAFVAVAALAFVARRRAARLARKS